MKNANEFNQLLLNLNACNEAVKWAEGKTWKQVYNECPHGDWLLWLFSKVSDDRRKLVLAAARCANTVRHLMKDERSRKAVDVAISYGNGDSTKDELKDAAYAAYAAYAAGVSASARAAYAAAGDGDGAYAAGVAVSAAAYDADTVYADARKQNQQKTADIVRNIISIEDFGL